MKRRLIAVLIMLVVVVSLSACAKRNEDTQGKSITIQEWLDSKGGSDNDTLTVTIISFENPAWAVVKDSSDATVHLYRIIVDGENKNFEEAGLTVGDTIVISCGKYNEYEGIAEITEAVLIEIERK